MRPILLFTVMSVAAASTGCGSDIAGPGYRSGPPDVRRLASVSTTVPFKARYIATFAGFGPGPGCDGRLSLQGAGTGTHLGKFTVALGFCGRADGTLDTGMGTFVAANGDELHIIFNGVSDGGSPVLHFTSYVTFVGGTGRFEGATGTATVDGSFDGRTGSGPADWNGMITLPRGGQ